MKIQQAQLGKPGNGKQPKTKVMKPYLIGIAGGSASGKSRFLRQISQLLGEQATVLSLDDFYKPFEEQSSDENGVVNFDVPDSINKQHFLKALRQLQEGQSITIEEYHFNNPDAADKTYKHLESRPILLIEGLFIFYFKEVFDQLDLKVFINADDKIRFARRIARDTKERGISPEMVAYQWDHHVIPCFEKFLHPFRNKVDLVVNNNQSFDKALRILHQYLESESTWRTNLQ